jgi:acetylornithine aminotransferase
MTKPDNLSTSNNPVSHEVQTPLLNTYARLPVAFVRGQGSWLFDAAGHRYLDALSGIAVCGLGHAHPAITQVIQQQAANLLHTSNMYHIPAQEQLAKELTRISGLSQCFFSNSGAEANEAAIKLARLYGHAKGIDNPQIIVMERAFHGRTLATLSASGNRKIQAGFEPLVGGFVRAPFNDIASLQQIAANSPDVVSLWVESIQGEGGIRIADAGYLRQLRQLCDQHGWLLMLDEIQSGNGRTGKYFAYQHESIQPDIVTTAKGLGNGIPIAACLVNQQTAQIIKPGQHGSTFGGNPFACAVAQQVIQTLLSDRLIERATSLGHYLLQAFKDRLEGADYIKEVRGQGLMIGIELQEPCQSLVSLALAKRLLINVTQDTTIRLLPPLIFSDSEADQLVNDLCQLIKVYYGDERSRPRPKL